MDGRAEVAAAGARAKNTTAYTYGAISVWAAKTTVQCNFITFLSKSVLEVGVKRIVGFVQPQGVPFSHKKTFFSYYYEVCYDCRTFLQERQVTEQNKYFGNLS
ncbi:MAG: hypothetical protein IKA09_05115 [Lachnospiraceae bacterium]|nr:hypothetical protein [Lachnospiraceae bacterium]